MTLFHIALLSTNQASAGIGDFFRPIPRPGIVAEGASSGLSWKARPIVAIPALKITESNRDGAIIDANLLASTGGGLSVQRLRFDVERDKWTSDFSFSPATILLTGNLADESGPIDLSYATTVGFFNNLLMVGAGVDFGVVGERSRFFGLVSIGINFNNAQKAPEQ